MTEPEEVAVAVVAEPNMLDMRTKHIGREVIIDGPRNGTGTTKSDNRGTREPKVNEQTSIKSKNKPRPKGARIEITQLLEPGLDAPKYEFVMLLDLRETGRGRWNKLEMDEYKSIHLGNGEVLGLGLKHQKPFYFSK
jgi:hypothetical protein